eukprot:scaffold6609_cov34-Tisochrysis_lutea.AAC.5
MGVAASVTSTHRPDADEMSQFDTSRVPREQSKHERPEAPVWRSTTFSRRANGAVECIVAARRRWAPDDGDGHVYAKAFPIDAGPDQDLVAGLHCP